MVVYNSQFSYNYLSCRTVKIIEIRKRFPFLINITKIVLFLLIRILSKIHTIENQSKVNLIVKILKIVRQPLKLLKN